MAQTYTQRKKAGAAPERAAGEAKGPSIRQLAAGAAPSADQMGSRVDLPGEIREKMESSFGADFSNVKLYESQTVADAGAQAVTQGSNIAFAPGQLDLTSTAGQALLGHELSHVVSQASGESAGQGFLNDAGLEAQADRQGMLAAQGESAYSGPVSPVGASSAVSAAGPMQAKKDKTPRTKDGTDVSEFAGDKALDISEPMGLEYDQNGPDARYFGSSSSNLYDAPEMPDEAALDTEWHRTWMNDPRYNHNQAAADAAEAGVMGKDWNEMSEGEQRLNQMLFPARAEHRAENDMTYANYKLGIANARKRRGLDRPQE